MGSLGSLELSRSESTNLRSGEDLEGEKGGQEEMDKRDPSDLILDPRGVRRWGPKAQPAHPMMARARSNLSVLHLRAR